MQTITKCLVVLILSLSVECLLAQDSIPKVNNQTKITELKEMKTKIEAEEKEALKVEVERIDLRLQKGEITIEEAQALKMEMAKKRALNIENRTAILDNKIALLERNEEGYSHKEEGFSGIIRLGYEEGKEGILYIGKKENDTIRNYKYDRRTKSEFVFALGFNNAIIEGQSFNDSPYKVGGSRFVEFGWAYKTRIFKNTNFARLKYGVSLMINGLKPDDNQFFVNNNGQTTLETFPENLRKSKLSVSNLVFPVHLELGSSKKIEKENYFRYSTRKKFKIGLGGYAGFNVGTRQKLKYDFEGDRVKDKQKRGFNTSNFVYGLSSYIAFGDTALYVKYDLSPIFQNQTIDQNNISVGVRFDMD